MTVQCVTIKNNHLFKGNPLAEQFKLRYRAIKQRQNWDIPEYDGMEYDQYDNPATTYLVWSDAEGLARGVSRLYPTDRKFMLEEHFSHLVTYGALPAGENILEASRFCIDHTLPSIVRERIARELILAYLQYGMDNGIKQYVGIMYPVYWQRLFVQAGWEPFWLGETLITSDGKKSRAGGVTVSATALEKVRTTTGIHLNVLKYSEEGERYVQVA